MRLCKYRVVGALSPTQRFVRYTCYTHDNEKTEKKSIEEQSARRATTTTIARPTARRTGLFRYTTSGNRSVGLYTTHNAVTSVACQRTHENDEKISSSDLYGCDMENALQTFQSLAESPSSHHGLHLRCCTSLRASACGGRKNLWRQARRVYECCVVQPFDEHILETWCVSQRIQVVNCYARI